MTTCGGHRYHMSRIMDDHSDMYVYLYCIIACTERQHFGRADGSWMARIDMFRIDEDGSVWFCHLHGEPVTGSGTFQAQS